LEPLKLLNFDFNANPDLVAALNSNADPDPASKNNADPWGSGSTTLFLKIELCCLTCRPDGVVCGHQFEPQLHRLKAARTLQGNIQSAVIQLLLFLRKGRNKLPFYTGSLFNKVLGASFVGGRVKTSLFKTG
jgi:hypothetical protein